MTSKVIITTFVFAAIILAFIYMLLSVHLRRASGVFIAMGCHLVMGMFSLPSIGLYIILLALIEFIIAVLLLVNKNKSQT